MRRILIGHMGAAVICHEEWETALERARNAALEGIEGDPDLALLFVSAHWYEQFGDIVPRARAMIGARCLIGCSGQGVIGPAVEVEDQPAIALMALRLPGAVLHPCHMTHEQLA